MSSFTIQELFKRMPQKGHVKWIGLRPGKRKKINIVSSVEARASLGLVGDRFAGVKNQKRQVTIIQEEHLITIGSIMKKEIRPEWTRRNIVVSQINLLALVNQKFQIGEAILEATGYCHPCSRMEEALGEGGYNAMRGHGGITAKVIEEGIISVGNSVYLL